MNNKEKELINSYVVGMFMLTMLDEWGDMERRGAVAKIHNIITKKHNNFHAQILDLKAKKRKKISRKCELFAQASALATLSWKEVIEDIEANVAITANVVIHNLYRLNREKVVLIYGFTDELFLSLTKKTETGTTLSSCRMARLLSEKVASKLKD